MTVQVCVLASGSSGNATLIQAEGSALLIDAGISVKELARRAEEVGCPLDRVAGVCISHEHSDHVCGLAPLQQRHGVAVYANRGTSEAFQRNPALATVSCHLFTTGQTFTAGVFTVEPFSVPHDAYEPVGFIVTVAGVRIGVVTDMGMPTQLIRARLRDCRAMVVESNHDEALLRNSKRPEYLKQRILGRQGHLSNAAAAALLAEIASPTLEAVFLAHLSEDCNRGELALKAARASLAQAGFAHVAVHLTYPDRLSAMWTG